MTNVDGKLVGDPLERSSFESLQWNVNVNSGTATSKSGDYSCKQVKKFLFDSALKRMSAIIEAKHSGDKIHDHFAVCKGAPEVLEGLFATVPKDYEKQYKEYVSGGYRVLSLAYKVLKESEHTLKAMKRDEIEKDLTFAGFLIFECPIKKASKKIVKELKASGHLVKMITGDNILTAAHVAKEIEISNNFSNIYFIEVLWKKFVY